MGTRMLLLACVVAVLVSGCTAPQADDAGKASVETTSAGLAIVHGDPANDALLKAASEVSTSSPVRIIGYELVLWQNNELDFEVFAMKSGQLMQPTRKWGAGPAFPALETRPHARITPSSDQEARSQRAVIESALARAKDEQWGSDEAMVRIYLLEDATGARFLMSPDGETVAPAPPLAPL